MIPFWVIEKLPSAGAQYMEERDSEIRQRSAFFISKIGGERRSPSAGAGYMEARSGNLRQLNSFFCLKESFIRRFIEGREPTISLFLPVHARHSASSMPRIIKMGCDSFR
ncbi:hypothetical protein [Ignatzschineria sp. F8392]|uniref:hypothetical protein n=1 Tax=Ignatzschineria sp. F8392 TaxID=1980117 RepID=UPI00117BCFC6|nr:hypothetical protein [Ignatzschineria sp. F8392]